MTGAVVSGRGRRRLVHRSCTNASVRIHRSARGVPPGGRRPRLGGSAVGAVAPATPVSIRKGPFGSCPWVSIRTRRSGGRSSTRGEALPPSPPPGQGPGRSSTRGEARKRAVRHRGKMGRSSTRGEAAGRIDPGEGNGPVLGPRAPTTSKGVGNRCSRPSGVVPF